MDRSHLATERTGMPERPNARVRQRAIAASRALCTPSMPPKRQLGATADMAQYVGAAGLPAENRAMVCRCYAAHNDV